MKSRISSVSLIVISLCLMQLPFPPITRACSVGGDPSGKVPTYEETIKGSFRFSDAVFLGTVLSNDIVPAEYNEHTVTFGVVASWKGTIGKIVDIRTGSGRGDCGAGEGLAVDYTYLIFASYNADESILTTSMFGVIPFDSASEAISVLDYINKSGGYAGMPTAGQPSDFPVLILTLASTSLVCGASFKHLVSRNRRKYHQMSDK